MQGSTIMAELVFRIAPDSLDTIGFMAEFGGIYEHSPWVAEGMLAGGIGAEDRSVSHFAARMAAIVDAADDDARLALLRAHPELAGKLAVAGGLTAESTAELPSSFRPAVPRACSRGCQKQGSHHARSVGQQRCGR